MQESKRQILKKSIKLASENLGKHAAIENKRKNVVPYLGTARQDGHSQVRL